ncbi:endonuclease NucS [Candidatus Woesearchaeota archaeon]|nr:endonuclease NucS [Candidatus Woesearchaeota archaeon]
MDSHAVKIRDAIRRNETIVIGCECDVEYSGRAEAYLPIGERLIVIKADNTLLVHQPEGNAPINYMKPDAKHSVKVEDGKLYLQSQNLKMKEYLDIRMSKVHFVASHQLKDGQKIQIIGTEKDMSEMIYNNPTLVSPDFKPLSMEEHTKYGFIDVFGYDKDNNLVIVECKRYCADLSAVTQLRRYVEKMKKLKGTKNVRGIIAAPKITGNAEQMAEDWGFSFIAVEPPKYKERYNKDQKTLEHF